MEETYVAFQHLNGPDGDAGIQNADQFVIRHGGKVDIHHGLSNAHQLLSACFKQFVKHFLFSGKMFVDRTCRDACFCSNLPHGGFLIAGF